MAAILSSSQDNPAAEIFAAGVDALEAPGASSDWRLKIDSALLKNGRRSSRKQSGRSSGLFYGEAGKPAR
jgi:hypothetical protein